MSGEDLIQRTVLRKGKLNIMQNTSICPKPGEQVQPEFYSEAFEEIPLQLERRKCEAIEKDLETGFRLFSAVIYCPEAVTELYQLYQFLSNILATETSRTILKATVNTIMSGKIFEKLNRKRMNGFFSVLEKTFDLKFGKVLLATIPRAEMEKMIEEDWPFFASFQAEMEMCRKETNCSGVNNLLRQLGKFFHMEKKVLNQDLFSF